MRLIDARVPRTDTGSDAVPLDGRFGRFGLSRQESRVLGLAMGGRIDKEIAAEMGISLGTVRVYWKRIRFKTGSTRSETIANLAQRDSQADFDALRERGEELRREIALREPLDRLARVYEAAFRASGVPFAVLEGETAKVALANAAFAALFGVRPEEMEGRPLSAWLALPKGFFQEAVAGERVRLPTREGLAPLRFVGEGASVFVAWAEGHVPSDEGGGGLGPRLATSPWCEGETR